MSLSFVLRKLATYTLLPLGITMWLLLVAAITKKRPFIALALIWLYIICMPFTGGMLMQVLEYQYPRMPIQECPPADAVLVLGGLVADAPFGPGSVEWTDAVDRFEQGVLLVKAGKAPRLNLSGGRVTRNGPLISEPEVMREIAVQRGIPRESIVVVPETEHTAAEAAAISIVVQRLNAGRAILVTSAFHMPRAVLLFRSQNMDVVPFPVDYHTQKEKPVELLDFIPHSGGLTNSETAIKEFYGWMFYKIFPPSRS